MKLYKTLAVLALFSCAGAALVSAQEQSDPSRWDEPIFPPDAPVIIRGDDSDMPEVPNPGSTPGPLPPDDTVFMLTPAPEFGMRGGYAGYGDKYKNGAGTGVVVFLDAGRLGVLLNVDAAAGQGGFGFLDGELKLRMRRPVDSKRVSKDLNDTAPRIWWGFGGDVGWRWAETEGLDDYLKVQGVAILGTMRAFKSKRTGRVKCVIHAFGKTGLGLYDNRVQTSDAKKWAMPWNAGFDTYVRPMVGAEALAQCNEMGIMGNMRLITDVQHVFTFGPAGDTTLGKIQYSQTYPVKGNWQVGFYGKAEVVREWGHNGLPADHPASQGRTMPGIFGGLEIRY